MQCPLQDIAAQILILGQLGKMIVDISAIDLQVRAALLRSLERNGFKQSFHHCVQAPGADVFGCFIDVEGNLREALNTVFCKFDIDIFSANERLIL